MKNTKKRVLSFILGLIMVISMIPVTLIPSSAAVNDGMTFESKRIYLATRQFDEELNTIYASVCIDEDIDTPGVIISNYEKPAQPYVTLEVVSGGKVKLHYSGEKWTSSNTNIIDEILFDAVDIRTGDWTDIVVTRDISGTDAVFVLYVDGAVAQTVTKTKTADKSYKYYTKNVTRNGFIIGADNSKNQDYTTANSNYFKGAMKEIAVYSTPMTASEVKKLYYSGVKDDAANLVAHYDLAKYADSKVIPDLSGNGCTLSQGYYSRPKELPEYAYSFALVGDTQSSVYADMTNNKDTNKLIGYTYNWIVNNAESKKIKYVFGVGDITEKNGTADDPTKYKMGEWEIAKEGISKLDAANIPYVLVPGDHDKTLVNGVYDYTKYNETFYNDDHTLKSRITGYYDQSAENQYSANYRINNYYINFEIANTKYMFLALEVAPNNKILEWANELVAANPDRRVIITTHAYLFKDGNRLGLNHTDSHNKNGADGDYDKNNGEMMWDEFVSLHPNICMIFSGHITAQDTIMTQAKGVHGNTVTQILVNPQYNNPNHTTVCMLYFSEDGKQVHTELIGVGETTRVQANNPSATDVLYRNASEFDFTLIYDNDKSVYKTEILSSGGVATAYRVYYSNGTYDDLPISIPGGSGGAGLTVVSVVKTKTEGLVDTYTITFSDNSKAEFTVTNGEKGDKGDAGATGATGAAGQPGANGTTPHIGTNGNWYIGTTDTGIKAEGEPGEDGSQGIKGEKGDTGETGAQGPKGDKGETGPQGPQGDAGEDGEGGASGNLAMVCTVISAVCAACTIGAIVVFLLLAKKKQLI